MAQREFGAWTWLVPSSFAFRFHFKQVTDLGLTALFGIIFGIILQIIMFTNGVLFPYAFYSLGVCPLSGSFIQNSAG